MDSHKPALRTFGSAAFPVQSVPIRAQGKSAASLRPGGEVHCQAEKGTRHGRSRTAVPNAKIKESDLTFHPKTVNGCVWKLVEKFPDTVYKPAKGLFRLVKYKNPVN